jgi:hypothetical protein
MTIYSEHKRFERSDGNAAVTIEMADHGLCRFVTWKLYDPAPDIPEIGGPAWVPTKWSGLYENLNQAEAAATLEIERLSVDDA